MGEVRVCPVTGELLGEGEFVSRSAVNRLVTAVSDLPELVDDLAYAARGLRRGMQPAGGVASSREPVNLGLMLEVEEMTEALWTWAQALTAFVMGPRYFVPRGDWAAVRRVFVAYRDRIVGWVEAPQLVDEVCYAVGRLEHLASPSVRVTSFAGRCPSCGVELMAAEGAVEASCVCGVQVEVEEAREVMRRRAGERPVPRPRAREIAEILSHRPIPESTVRSWCKRARLQPVAIVSGRRLYRPGDLVALMEASR